jgi:hypothetical protein
MRPSATWCRAVRLRQANPARKTPDASDTKAITLFEGPDISPTAWRDQKWAELPSDTLPVLIYNRALEILSVSHTDYYGTICSSNRDEALALIEDRRK